MYQFEYMILDLNMLPRRQTLEHALNNAGEEGWELLSISSTNLAIFKRVQKGPGGHVLSPPVVRASGSQLAKPRQASADEREKLRLEIENFARTQGLSLAEILNGDSARSVTAPTVKYRDPANSNHTWSGRGRMPKWLADAVAAGLPKSNFRI